VQLGKALITSTLRMTRWCRNMKECNNLWDKWAFVCDSTKYVHTLYESTLNASISTSLWMPVSLFEVLVHYVRTLMLWLARSVVNRRMLLPFFINKSYTTLGSDLYGITYVCNLTLQYLSVHLAQFAYIFSFFPID